MFTLFVLVFVIYISSGIILVYGIWQKQLDLKLLIVPYFAWGVYIMTNIFNLFGEYRKEKLAHSEDLVNKVFNKWFTNPLEYKPYFERRNSKNEESKELIDEKYKGLAIEHLQDKEYLSIRKAWESRIISKKEYSTKTAKLWENIEHRVKENIPVEFIEWNGIGTCPSTYYLPIIYLTVRFR